MSGRNLLLLLGGHTWGVSLRLGIVCVLSECKIESLQCCASRRDVPQVRPKLQGDRIAFKSERKRKDVMWKPPVDSWRTHLGCVPTFGGLFACCRVVMLECCIEGWSYGDVVGCLYVIMSEYIHLILRYNNFESRRGVT